jgi:serine/threonine protein kinase
MAELRESCESTPSADSTQQAGEPKPRSLPLGASGLPLADPAPIQSGDDGLLAPGARLDDYEIVARLGSGGMGQVYRVRHLRLDREFALKIISARHISAEARQRFEREMKAAGRTSHPNVILATDAGESQGCHYLVMELVSGTDLAGLVKQIGPLPVADACEIIRQAALGLQAIHEAGLVHRDIKPPNLMLTPGGSVKVLDLGLARLVGEAGSALTENGSLGGTADYMAPEQALDLRFATIVADLYSLGCTLYCLLVGRPPFGDDRHSSLASKLIAHRAEPVPPIASLRPELAQKPDLLRLLGRLLAKESSARPSRPREVADALAPLAVGHDLSRLFGGQATAGRAPLSTTRTYRSLNALSRARRSRRRSVLAAGGVACLGLIVGLIAWGRGPQHPGGSNAAAPFRPAPVAPSSASETFPPLRIESLEIQHYRGNPTQLQGTIGVLSRAAVLDDNVRVSARLSAPGYCYLIALNPDGSMQLCPEAAEHAPPALATEIVYPAKPGGYYGLTDGTGLQAFVLVASRAPLPAFDSWPARANLAWPSSSAGEAWRYDGHDFVFLGDPRRGTERRLPSAAPAPFASVCRYLSQLPDVDAIQATAFPVLPADGSKSPPRLAP